jgi:carotenoid cleavage dioxygenase-like enzyme
MTNLRPNLPREAVPDSLPVMTGTGFVAGFETLRHETADLDLPWQGDPPAWLGGELLRTGPAMFAVGRHAYRHWFDGLAMLHRFALAPHGVRYSNRFLRGDSFSEAAAAAKICRGEFATNAQKSYPGRVLATFQAKSTDNGNVNVACFGDGDFVALTEVPGPLRFDRETLATLGKLAWADDIASHVTTAHPIYDHQRHVAFNVDTLFHQPCLYRFTRMQRGGTSRTIVADIPVDRPAYMHSFGMSERFLILVECPLVTHPARLLLGGRPFIEAYRWRPERGLRLTIVDKDSGAIVRRATTEPCFGFHIANAFERDGEVVLDMITYNDADIVQRFYLDRLRNGGGDVTGALTRYAIPLGQGEVARQTLSDVNLELPFIDQRRSGGRDYATLWAVGQTRTGFMDRLQKYDFAQGTVSYWHEPGSYPGEPVFVARPGADDPADGVILSVTLDAARARSCLLVLDAATLEERARAYAPHVIPFGFHGDHFAKPG